MTQTELIDWIVFHLDCTDCPMYVRCRIDHPNTCREYIGFLFQAVDNVTKRAIQDHIERIRRTKTKLIKTVNPDERRKLQNEIADLKRQLREVNMARGEKR